MDYEIFYEELTMKAVTDTIAMLLKYPFGFHGDTGIRDYLYARLHVHGGDKLQIDDPRPGYSTLLLQSEHYTRVKYRNTGQTGQGARFDLALTSPPPKNRHAIEDRFAENLNALFAFELGKNKSLEKVIDPDMLGHVLNHDIDRIPKTSDVSKLCLELMRHELMQGWVIEFYDSRATNGAWVISEALDVCKELKLKEGKKLVVIFVVFSPDNKHHVTSNDRDVEQALITKLAEVGIAAQPELPFYSNNPLPSYQGGGWASSNLPSSTVADIFGNRAEFANRIIKIRDMEECGRASQYVNLSFPGKKNIAQIHPHENGIALVLSSIKGDQPQTFFDQIPVRSLAGYRGTNARWLDGKGDLFERKGPAIAFLIPDDIAELDDDSMEWQEVAKLLDYAKTLK